MFSICDWLISALIFILSYNLIWMHIVMAASFSYIWHFLLCEVSHLIETEFLRDPILSKNAFVFRSCVQNFTMKTSIKFLWGFSWWVLWKNRWQFSLVRYGWNLQRHQKCYNKEKHRCSNIQRKRGGWLQSAGSPAVLTHTAVFSLKP